MNILFKRIALLNTLLGAALLKGNTELAHKIQTDLSATENAVKEQLTYNALPVQARLMASTFHLPTSNAA